MQMRDQKGDCILELEEKKYLALYGKCKLNNNNKSSVYFEFYAFADMQV